jgi:hypothetical protein
MRTMIGIHTALFAAAIDPNHLHQRKSQEEATDRLAIGELLDAYASVVQGSGVPVWVR